MQKIILLFLFFIPFLVASQATLEPALSPLSSNHNYLYEAVYTEQVKLEDVNSSTASQKLEIVTYVDGVNRVKQLIARGNGGNQENLVNYYEYDGFGRSVKSYLPYSVSTSSLAFQNNAKSETLSYYDSDDFDFTTNPYTTSVMLSDPSGRIKEQANPGNPWKLSTGNTEKFKYQVDLITHGIYLFGVDYLSGNSNSPELKYNGTSFNADDFNITQVQGEHYESNGQFDNDNISLNFLDNKGRVILNRAYNNNAPHDTYYVYDDFDNLIYVIPPTAADNILIEINGLINISQQTLDDLSYQFRVDFRGRVVDRKQPGKGWEYFVYDKHNRMVLSQDANLKDENKWLYTKYDTYGRIAYTGFVTSYYHRSALRTLILTSSTNYETQSTNPITIDNTPLYYSNDVELTEVNDFSLLSINYYDSYVDTDGLTIPTSVFGVDVTDNTKGLSTVIKEKVLGTNQWITSVVAYDQRLRAIYGATKNNYLNTIDLFSLELDYIGKIIMDESVHQYGSNSDITIVNQYEYDHIKRLTSHHQKINNEAFKLIKKNYYDELGRLVTKDIGNTVTNPLQSIDYSFNIRGWLKEINDTSNLGDNLFALKISHEDPEDPGSTPLYNGNISEVKWKTAMDNQLRQYSFHFDALSRLTDANYSLNQMGGSNGNEDYSTKNISYDKMGNILSLNRYGYGEFQESGGNFITINNELTDNLSYVYYPNTNLLKDVVDNADNCNDPLIDCNDGKRGLFIDKNIPIEDNYTYDQNGNLKTDKNKFITSIEYNHLSLPTEITFDIPQEGLKKIKYIYSAGGKKLEKKYYDDILEINSKQYAGKFLYNDGELDLIMHPEGYIKKLTTGDFLYVYQHKDHLGNVRMNYADLNNDGTVSSSEILEEHNYYPFGGKHLGYNSIVGSEHLWKFNNVEEEKTFGLNFYEMSFRQYDPSIGRFTSLDPVIQFTFSPYSAFNNNPAFWSDPSGAYGEQYDYDYDRCEECYHMSQDEVVITQRRDEGVEAIEHLENNLDNELYDNMDRDIEFSNQVNFEISAEEGEKNWEIKGKVNEFLRSIPISGVPSTKTWGDLAEVFRPKGVGVGLYGIGEGHNLSDTKGSTSHDINAMDIPSNSWMELVFDNFDFSSNKRDIVRGSRSGRAMGFYLGSGYTMDTFYRVSIYADQRSYVKGYNYNLKGAEQKNVYINGRIEYFNDRGVEIDSILIDYINKYDVEIIHQDIIEIRD